MCVFTSTIDSEGFSEEQFAFIPLFDDVKRIIRRANKDSSECVVETTYGTYEWRTFPLDHEKIKEFLSRNAGEEVVMPRGLPLVYLERWVAGGELVQEKHLGSLTTYI